MIKFKKITSLLLLSTILVSPVTGFANSIDAKINEQNQKIETLEKNKKEAERLLDEVKNHVASVQAEVEAILTSKMDEEKKLNELTTQIEGLKEVINKRSERLKQQAVNVQINQSPDKFLEVILTSDSLNEAISRAYTLTTIVSANNEIIKEQKKDKEQVESLSQESKDRLQSIEEKSVELKEKEKELVEAQLNQEVQINEIQASVATEKSQKDKFIKQKEEAERKRQEELKAQAQRQAREEAARKVAEEKRLAREAQAQREVQAQREAQEQTKRDNDANESTHSNQSNNTVDVQPTPDATPAPSSGWALPVSSPSISSPFNMRENPTGGGSEFHKGIDLVGSTGEPIFATKAGTVVQTGFDYTGGGNFVIVSHGNGYYSHYLHLISIGVSTGQSVEQGAVVGGMGSTGRSTGTHLHFAIGTGIWSGFVDPAPFIGL